MNLLRFHESYSSGSATSRNIPVLKYFLEYQNILHNRKEILHNEVVCTFLQSKHDVVHIINIESDFLVLSNSIPIMGTISTWNKCKCRLFLNFIF